MGNGPVENETYCAYVVAAGEHEGVHAEDAEVGATYLGWTLAAVRRLH
jgi:hypothetical protein